VIKDYDEPLFIETVKSSCDQRYEEVLSEIKTLCLEQPFAVLATQGKGQPYTSLISFAISDDLKKLFFSTPTKTRKYNLIINNSKVSVMIDNRSSQPESINMISGLTITGIARPLEDPEVIRFWSAKLLERHSYLEKFIKAPSSSLILIDTTRFFYVRRFQEVYQWAPGDQ
jgi:general stress protein 26